MMHATLFAILAVTVWTLFLLVLRGTMQVWPVGQAGTYSRVITVGLLLVWVMSRGHAGSGGQTSGGGWRRMRPRGMTRWLAVMGGISVLINTLWFAGMQRTSATNAALLFRLDLLFVVMIGIALSLERISVAGAVIGAVMLSGLGLLMEVGRDGWAVHAVGDLLIVAAALGLAANAFVIRHIMKTLDGEAVATYNHFFSGVGFVVLACTQGFAVPTAVRMAPVHWWWIPGLGVVAAISLPIYYTALRRMAVWKLRVWLLLSPLLAAVADWLIWRQSLQGLQWLGAAMMLGGGLAFLLMASRGAPDDSPPMPRRLPPDPLRIQPPRRWRNTHEA